MKDQNDIVDSDLKTGTAEEKSENEDVEDDWRDFQEAFREEEEVVKDNDDVIDPDVNQEYLLHADSVDEVDEVDGDEVLGNGDGEEKVSQGQEADNVNENGGIRSDSDDFNSIVNL